MSAFGTKRTYRVAPHMSAFGSNPDAIAKPPLAVAVRDNSPYQGRFRAGGNACSLLHRYRHPAHAKGSFEPDCGSAYPYDNAIGVLKRCHSSATHNRNPR